MYSIEQDSKAKALTAAQKLQNHTITIQRTKIIIIILKSKVVGLSATTK